MIPDAVELAGLPGPGLPEQAHVTHEDCPVANIRQAEEDYLAIALQWCTA